MVGRNDQRCDRGDAYVVYTFKVTLRGTPKRGADYNVVKVKETCRSCQPAVWWLPVRV